MNDSVIKPIAVSVTPSNDKTLTQSRRKEIEELIRGRGLNPNLFSWKEEKSSEFQRPDVLVSKLIVHSTDFHFLFNSTRSGKMFFSRSPGLHSKVDEGQTGDWPYQIAAVRDWLTALEQELRERRDLRLFLEDTMSAGELDDLLPIYRRGVFDRDLEKFTNEFADTRNPLSLVMLDIDKFKLLNDTYGHAFGDDVLRFVGNTIKRCVTGKGKTYRYGGEEIAVLLPNHCVEEGAALAERIRKDIAAGSIGEKKITATVSAGVAELPAHAATGRALVEAADGALYNAKNLGRNLVRITGDQDPPQRERKTTRRAPDPTALTDNEVEQIVSEYFRYHGAHCPKDGSQLEIQEFRSDERVTVDLRVSCPRCGLQERIAGPS